MQLMNFRHTEAWLSSPLNSHYMLTSQIRTFSGQVISAGYVKIDLRVGPLLHFDLQATVQIPSTPVKTGSVRDYWSHLMPARLISFIVIDVALISARSK